MIHTSDLKYFIEIGRTQHLSRAAERIGITQPALTLCIQRMEKAVGLPLLTRSKKGVLLTAAGARLFEQAQVLLNQWDVTLRSIHSEADTVGGLIRLGCHSAVAQYTLPDFLPQLLREHKNLRFTLSHGLSRHMTEELISSKLDAAIVVNPVRHPDLVINELCEDQVTVWRAKNCLNSDLLMVEPSLAQTQDILKRLGKRGRTFTRTLESPSLEVLAQLLVAGTGSAILPKRVVSAFSDRELLTEVGAPIYHDKICLVYKPELKKTETGRVLIQAIQKTVK